MNRQIELYIDELILHGFPETNRNRIRISVENELSRLFSEKSLPNGILKERNLPLIHGGTFHINQSSRGDILGQQIAQSVFSAFNSNAISEK